VLGSTVLITGVEGDVIAQYQYDPFGNVIGYGGSADTNYTFTGQEYDAETDQYYFSARYHNANNGRFFSRDTYLGNDGDILSQNRYIYTKNNPLKYTDPTGNEEQSIFDTSPVIKTSLVSNSFGESNLRYTEKIATNLNEENNVTENFLMRLMLAGKEMEELNTKKRIWDYINPKKYYDFAIYNTSGAKWDIKVEEEYSKFAKSGVIIGNTKVDFDKPGNFMYGYAGAAGGIRYDVLSNVALFVQALRDLKAVMGAEYDFSIPFLPHIDVQNAKKIVEKKIQQESNDQKFIKQGYLLYQSYGLNINEESLGYFINRAQSEYKYEK